MHDTSHSLIRSASRFFSGTLLSRITGLLRDIAMAFAFGTHEVAAAFLVAFRLAHLLRRLFGEGALQTAFIPQFEALRAEEKKRASQFFYDLNINLTAILFLIVIFGMGLLEVFLRYGSPSVGNQEIARFTLIMMPSLLFICLYGLNASLLQCSRKFFTASVAPCAFNMVWIFGIFFLWHLETAAAMVRLSWVIIGACAAQWLITLPATLSELKALGTPVFKLSWFPSDLRHLAYPLLLGMIGVSASQINNALDVLFARFADPEGPAFLWYAIRLQQLPLALFGIAISGALLPPLARAAKNKEEVKYAHLLSFALRQTLALMIPITCGIFIMGDSCIQLIYLRGSFNIFSLIGTTECLWGYTLGLIPMSLVLILSPAFYAKNNYKVPTKGAVYSMGINLILNAFFTAGLGMGAASVAIATSLSAWFNFCYLAYYLKQDSSRENLNNISFPMNWVEGRKALMASVAGCAGVCFVDFFLYGGSNAYRMISGELLAYPSSLINNAFHFILQGGAFVILFSLTAWFLKYEELKFLIGKRKEPVS